MAYLMVNAKSKGIKLAAAVALYDRAWGRPQQTIRIAESEPPVHYYTTKEIREELVRRGLQSVLGITVPKPVDNEMIEINPRPRTNGRP
jgi:hypothetical protein